MARIVFSLFFSVVFFGALWAVSGAVSSARAQSADQAYIVHDVKVDTLAESAVKARDKAFGEAQTAAFAKLAQRFYTTEELASLAAPDARTISGMVQDFEVVNEQLSTKRYIGTFTFRFKAGAVNRYFKRMPQYVDASEPAIRQAGLLVLPFFQQTDTAGKTASILWDGAKNPWLKAWQKADLNGNPTLVLPAGDVSDVMDVHDDQATAYNPAGLKRMQTRYAARDAVIVVAKFDQTKRNLLTVDLYRTDRRKAELMKTLTVPVAGERVLSALLDKAVARTKTELEGNWKLVPLVEGGYDLTSGIMPAPVAGTDPSLQPTAIPQANGVQTNVYAANGTGVTQPVANPAYAARGGQVRAATRFTNLSEWLSIRRSLNGVPGMTGLRIVALKSNEAVIDMNYADWAAFNAALASRGLSLSGSGTGAYQLVRRTSASAYR